MSGTLWYLGYGSNMNPDVLTGRRGVVPRESVPVRVPGYKLTFQCPGFPYIEPSFASIEALRPGEATQVLHGVAFLITAEEYEMIRRTEGLGYGDVEVLCEPLGQQGDREALHARALIQMQPFRRDHQLPSRRYWKLLVDGARHHELPAQYQDWLEGIQSFGGATRPGQKVGRIVLLIAFAPFFLSFFALRHVWQHWLGLEPPFAMAWGFEWLSKVMWGTYKWVLRPIFGDGGDGEPYASSSSCR